MAGAAMRVMGLDPGLRRTGWGVVDVAANGRLSPLAWGVVGTDEADELAVRLCVLHDGLVAVLEEWAPTAVAVEETLSNRNPVTTLKLGMARGTALLVGARAGLPVAQYLPMVVKKAVVGTGHAEKAQVQHMVRLLLPGLGDCPADAADALAVAICHAHTAATQRSLAGSLRAAAPLR